MRSSESEDHETKLVSLVSKKFALPLEVLLVIAGGVGLAVSSPTATVWMLGLWVVLALGYVVVAIHRLVRAMHSSKENRQLLPGDSPKKGTWARWFLLDVTLIGFASAMGLTSALMVSIGSVDGVLSLVARVLAPLGIVLAWVLLQLGFSRLYADNWFKKHNGGGLEFPGTEEPGLIEFTYAAFSVGAALQAPHGYHLANAADRNAPYNHLVLVWIYPDRVYCVNDSNWLIDGHAAESPRADAE